MELQDYMDVLAKIGAAVFATVDADGKPRTRYANVGVANENGIFFMTKESNDFYKQLMANEHVSISGLLNDEDGIQAITVDGKVRAVDQAYLEAILKDNPYVKDVYPDEESRKDVVALQVYGGHGSYMNLKAHSKGMFDFSAE
jgi:uncharacterized pyridoxamine 5'-phosphate oxidase family protein